MAKQDIIIGTQNAKAGDTLYTAFTKAEANFTELYAKDVVIEADITALESDVGILQTDLDVAEASIVTLQADVVAAEADILVLESDVGILQTDLDVAEASIVTLQADVVAAEADILVLESDVLAAEGNITTLQTDVTGLDTRLKVVEGDTPAAVPGGMFVSDGLGGGEFIRIQGWEQLTDTNTTVTTPTQTIPTGTRALWINDGGSSTISKLPSDVGVAGHLWDTVANKIVPIAAFDTYSVRVSFKAEDYAGTTPELRFELDIGGGLGVIVSHTIPLLKGGAEQPVTISFPVFTGSTFVTNGGSIYLTFTGTGSCKIFDSSILIVRESKNYV